MQTSVEEEKEEEEEEATWINNTKWRYHSNFNCYGPTSVSSTSAVAYLRCFSSSLSAFVIFLILFCIPYCPVRMCVCVCVCVRMQAFMSTFLPRIKHGTNWPFSAAYLAWKNKKVQHVVYAAYFVEEFRVAVTDILMDHAILTEAQQNSIDPHVVATRTKMV